MVQFKKILYNSFFLLFFMFSSLLPMAGLTPEEQMAFDMINNLSEEDKIKFMEEMQKEFEKLPPEEQEKLLIQIQQEEERLKPALDEYMQTKQQQTQPAVVAQPQEEKPAKEEVKEEKPAISPSKKLEIDSQTIAAENIIAQILNTLNILLTTAQTIPNFAQTVQTWGEKQEISDWTTANSWNALASQIEELVRKLHIIKDRDIESKEYKYLVHLIENKSLYNYLQKLNNILQKYESNIEGLSIESMTLSKTAENAIKKKIGTILDAIYSNTLIEDIDTLLSNYMTTADKIKAEREAMRKKATTHAGKPQKNKAVRYTGTPQEPAYQPLNVPTSAPSYGSSYSDSYGSLSSDKPQGFVAPAAPSNLPSSGGGSKAPGVETDKTKAEKKDKKPETDKTADKHFAAFESALNAASVSIDDGNLKEMYNLIQSKAELDEEVLKEFIPDVITQLRIAIKEASALRRQIKKLSATLKNKYADDYKKSIKESHPLLSRLTSEGKKVQKLEDASLSLEKQKSKKLLETIVTQIERLLKFDINA